MSSPLHNIAHGVNYINDIKKSFGLLILVIIFSIILIVIVLNKHEKFYYKHHPYRFCTGWCYGKDKTNCMKCSNCGLCDEKCARGDRFGPSDGRKCKQWIHNDISDEPDYDKFMGK
jgi:hypothetical protein